MILNRATGLDLGLPGNLVKADAPVRYPFIWDASRQDRTQSTGAAPNGTYLRAMARNTGEVFGYSAFSRPNRCRGIWYVSATRPVCPVCGPSRRSRSPCARAPGRPMFSR
jgi:hypothetical protein